MPYDLNLSEAARRIHDSLFDHRTGLEVPRTSAKNQGLADSLIKDGFRPLSALPDDASSGERVIGAAIEWLKNDTHEGAARSGRLLGEDLYAGLRGLADGPLIYVRVPGDIETVTGKTPAYNYGDKLRSRGPDGSTVMGKVTHIEPSPHGIAYRIDGPRGPASIVPRAGYEVVLMKDVANVLRFAHF